MAVKCGADVCAYYVKSAFQPQFELDDALKMARHLQVDMKVLEVDILSETLVTCNQADRCYHCKKIIFSVIEKAANKDGFTLLLDGTNASDDAGDRPGMRALNEMCVRSPLRECGLTKSEIRELSQKSGLFTWNKPAYACLATRISTGMEITSKKLIITETAENYLFSLGFTDFRVRMIGESAKIQISASQIDKLIRNRDEIVVKLKQYYSEILLDLEARE